MALFKPNGTTESVSFTGICKCNIINVEDKSDLFDWADVYLQVTLLQNGSKYTRNANIVGGFEKDAKGNITGGSVLKRMYAFFDTIGCKAGVNIKGEWEEDDGKAIDNIADYLNDRFLTKWDGDSPGADGKYLGYFYKAQPKKEGKNAYNVAHYRLYPANEENQDKLKNDVDWMKSKGYIKEVTEDNMQTVMTIDDDKLGLSALDNL